MPHPTLDAVIAATFCNRLRHFRLVEWGVKKKLVELPDGCMITDRRTWERQQRRVASLEVENRRLAERLQGLETANEALRERVAEAEDIAVDQMAAAEIAEQKADRARTASDLSIKALRAANTALGRVRQNMGRSAYGGTLTDAHDLVRKAIRSAAKI